MEQTENAVLIRCDLRERRSGVAEALQAAYPDVDLVHEVLETGDYILAPDLAVERKAAADFVASIQDRRLFEQAARLRVSFDRPAVVVEGSLWDLPTAMSPEAIDGARAHLFTEYCVAVFSTVDVQGTARLLYRLARQAQVREPREMPLRSQKPADPNLAARFILEGLPRVGPIQARKLLAHFGTPARVLGASAEELAAVAGFGKKSAETIWTALHTRYQPPEEER